ncbi:MAG: hypothetical protein ACXVBO_13835, partial [Isosphaeraceae bacterium]
MFTTHLLTFYYLSLFRPGVEFVTGPGLLDATRLRLRKRELIEAGEKRLEAGPVPGQFTVSRCPVWRRV